MSSESFIKEQIEKIQTELKENPGSPSLFNDLGVGYHLIGSYVEAVRYLKEAVDQEKKNSTYLYNLANAYAELQEYELAQKYYLDSLQIKPDHIPSLTNLADSYESTGDVEKARELFRYVTKIAPENAVASYNYGNFLLRQNEHIEAAKLFERALEIEETFVAAYHNIAWILKEVKAFDNALNYALKGLEYEAENEELNNLVSDIKKELK